MAEPNEDIITNEPVGSPRSREFTKEPSLDADGYETRQSSPPIPASKTWRYVLLVFGIPVLLSCFFLGGVGLLISATAKSHEAAARMQSINNCKHMALALNYTAAGTATGAIPPSYGSFPRGSTANQSFFVSLLPYIDENDLYRDWPAKTTTPVKTYIAPGDPFNPGTGGLISYGSNGTVLQQDNANPTFPASFGGRTSGVIVVFERTAKTGQTWSSSTNYLIDDGKGSSIPEFTSRFSWVALNSINGQATALTSAGCVVGMADGSARVVTQSSANAGWAWAMNPQNPSSQPAGW